LRVSVNLPAELREGWLVYADVWNPRWTATVNGFEAPVERAFLAYKAVKLGPGKNDVEFRFRDPVRSICFRLLGINALIWIVAVVAVAAALAGGSLLLRSRSRDV